MEKTDLYDPFTNPRERNPQLSRFQFELFTGEEQTRSCSHVTQLWTTDPDFLRRCGNKFQKILRHCRILPETGRYEYRRSYGSAIKFQFQMIRAFNKKKLFRSNPGLSPPLCVITCMFESN